MATLLASQTSNTTGLSYWGSNARSCQTFTMPSGYDTIEYVVLELREGGTLPGNYNVAIYATSGGLPTGSALTSVNLTGSSIGSSYGAITANFTDITVTPGAKYAIVTSQTSTTSISNSVYWGHADGATYSGGGSYWSSNGGSSWTTLSGDWDFAVYGSISVTAPTVSSTSPTSITSTSTVLGGNVTSSGGGTVTSRGVVLSSSDSTPDKNQDRTITIGSGTGSFSSTVGSLSPATLYYFRAWATNSAGTSYGNVYSWTTSSTTPSVSSGSASSVSSTTATCSGNVTSDGGATVTTRGICYNTTGTPTTSSSKVASGSGTGSFSSNLTGLTANTTYYWRAYATNSNGTVYGTEYTFTTKDIITQWGQSFTTTSAGTLTKIDLYLKEILASSSTARVKLYSDSGGSPGTEIASASKTVSSSSYGWYRFSFNEDLAATTTYWIVLENPYVVGSYHQYWGADDGGTYGAVKYSTDDGTTWVSKATTTAAFKAYVQPSLTVEYDVTVNYKKRYL